MSAVTRRSDLSVLVVAWSGRAAVARHPARLTACGQEAQILVVGQDGVAMRPGFHPDREVTFCAAAADVVGMPGGEDHKGQQARTRWTFS